MQLISQTRQLVVELNEQEEKQREQNDQDDNAKEVREAENKDLVVEKYEKEFEVLFQRKETILGNIKLMSQMTKKGDEEEQKKLIEEAELALNGFIRSLRI